MEQCKHIASTARILCFSRFFDRDLTRLNIPIKIHLTEYKNSFNIKNGRR